MPAFFTPDLLIIMAGIIQILGYLLINQIYLRLALLAGTLTYIAYYYTVAETPLWNAIFVSSMTVVTILTGLVALWARNAQWSVPKAHADLFALFQPLSPGDFRAIMRDAQRHVLDAPRIATVQGEVPQALYYVISGTFEVSKGKAQFVVPGPTFVGEVAYLMKTTSSATTTLPAGCEVLIWSRADLARRARQSPRFQLAMESVISIDLARKVSLAISPDAINT